MNGATVRQARTADIPELVRLRAIMFEEPAAAPWDSIGLKRVHLNASQRLYHGLGFTDHPDPTLSRTGQGESP